MKALVVDDDILNLEILNEHLEEAGFDVVSASGGEEALQKLSAEAGFDFILLDRMMPSPDGMAVMKEIRENPSWRQIPVIMQTAATQPHEVEEGIKAGVFYYLTKPFDRAVLLSIVDVAVRDNQNRAELEARIKEQKHIPSLLSKGEFHFKTIEEAKALASFTARAFPFPSEVVFGLSELLVNAVEHGLLEIPYEEKRDAMINGSWGEELSAKLALLEHQERCANLKVHREGTQITLECLDFGPGFDWQSFLKIDPNRISDPNGRGIAMACAMGFQELRFNEKGDGWTCQWELESLNRLPSDAQESILIIDENRKDLFDLSNMTKELGYRPICSSEAREALQWLHTNTPSAVILELSLPDIDGIDVVRYIRKNLKMVDIPIIAFSGHQLSVYEDLLDRLANAIMIEKSKGIERLKSVLQKEILQKCEV